MISPHMGLLILMVDLSTICALVTAKHWVVHQLGYLSYHVPGYWDLHTSGQHDSLLGSINCFPGILS